MPVDRVLRSSKYRDPLEIIMSDESRTWRKKRKCTACLGRSPLLGGEGWCKKMAYSDECGFRFDERAV